MALKIFIFSMFLISTVFYFIPIEDLGYKQKKEEIPQIIFENSKMFTLNKIGVSRVVETPSFLKYDNRDEMYFANITLKNLDSSKNFNFENIKADRIVKKDTIYDFIGNVQYARDDISKINTDFLNYDETKKIATNSHPFKAIYKTHNYDGVNLYLDGINDFIKSKNTHFKIDLKKEKGNK